MRILLVIDHLGVGGAQRQLANLALRLRKHHQHVDVFTYYPATDLAQGFAEAGISLITCLKRWRYSPRIAVALARQLRRGNYDIALSYLDTPNLYLELASLVSCSTQVVVSERSAFPPGGLSLRKRVQETFHWLADYVVANSHAHAKRLVDEFEWLKGRVGVIYNGVEDKLFKIPVKRSTEHSLNLLAIGTVVPQKNALMLAQALRKCLAQGLDVKVSWAGRHPPESADYIARIGDVLCHHDDEGRWVWLGVRDDVPLLLEKADALIHPSRLEGFPNAVCEALAAGRPVLASGGGDLPGLIEGGSAGFLFDPDDVDEVAEAIRRMCQASAQERETLAANGRRIAQEAFSGEQCVSRYLKLFRELLAARSEAYG